MLADKTTVYWGNRKQLKTRIHYSSMRKQHTVWSAVEGPDMKNMKKIF